MDIDIGQVCKLEIGDVFPPCCNGDYHANIGEPEKDSRCFSLRPCIHQTFAGMGIKLSLYKDCEGVFFPVHDTDPYPEGA